MSPWPMDLGGVGSIVVLRVTEELLALARDARELSLDRCIF